MRKLASHVENVSNLAKLAMESNIEEFLQLATKISQLLAKENGKVGA